MKKSYSSLFLADPVYYELLKILKIFVKKMTEKIKNKTYIILFSYCPVIVFMVHPLYIM